MVSMHSTSTLYELILWFSLLGVCNPQVDVASAKAKLVSADLQHEERGAMRAALEDVDDFSRWDFAGMDDAKELAGYFRKKLPSCAAGGRYPTAFSRCMCLCLCLAVFVPVAVCCIAGEHMLMRLLMLPQSGNVMGCTAIAASPSASLALCSRDSYACVALVGTVCCTPSACGRHSNMMLCASACGRIAWLLPVLCWPAASSHILHAGFL